MPLVGRWLEGQRSSRPQRVRDDLETLLQLAICVIAECARLGPQPLQPPVLLVDPVPVARASAISAPRDRSS